MKQFFTGAIVAAVGMIATAFVLTGGRVSEQGSSPTPASTPAPTPAPERFSLESSGRLSGLRCEMFVYVDVATEKTVYVLACPGSTVMEISK